MDLEDVFREEGDYEIKRRAMHTIRQERNIDAYPLVEGEISGPLRHNALVALASLDLDRTFPYLKSELKNAQDHYSWLGHPDYRACPFVLTMEVILREQNEKERLQESIDRFKPLSEKEKAFFTYTLRCLFYNEGEKERKMVL
ncbi:hypothetical protein HZA98_03685 [Candidatus Woesearchaeota archaeon]|nr:hypothetical protein [Candidatus Woesearchaeota archaeon]